MVRARTYWFGFVTCALLFACAGAGVKYYGMSGVRYEEGKLLGPSEADDKPFSMCKPVEYPDPEDPTRIKLQHKCVVMFSKDFFNLKRDYEDTKMRLEECERGNP